MKDEPIATPAMGHVIIAFDYGLRRIGVATGNLLTRTASPVTTLQVDNRVRWELIDNIVREWAPSRIVVGMPNSKSDGSLDARIVEFVQDLTNRYKLPVATVDEAFTSHAARAALSEQRRDGIATRRVRKADIDKYAACLIAEQWMNKNSEHG